MKSIRIFLLVAVLSTIMLVNFLAALHGYQSSMLEAEKLFDRKLADTASLIEAIPRDTYLTKITPYTGQTAFQIFDSNLKLLWQSSSTPTTQFAPLKTGFSEHNFNGYRWRTLVHHSTDGRWVLVGERLDQRYHLADSIILESVVPILLSIPLAGILVWLIIGHGLKSLQLLARDLAIKREDDLSHLDLINPPRELQPVLQSTNSLLSRLEASLERERRFSSDAAHELRTPLSALQLHIHNFKQSLSAEDQPALIQLEGDQKRMAHLVEQILALYRTTPEHYPAKFEVIDIFSLARDCIAESFLFFEARGQDISLDGDSTLLLGDHFALQLLIQNLLSNANKYTPEGGKIAVDVRDSIDGPILTVSDNGPGIAEAERERVLERFYRVGGDRHASGATGCGLGLSIVGHIAQIHQARLDLSNSTRGHGLVVSIHFPNSIVCDKGGNTR
ncbi:Swarming motility regulation sensor protein RssA [Zhongshania aliphaticivorans]|uniref:histidine kinase n=1 Tax=Zhongshania aliphaticivorans TaxID=1470434 RepID=A0A5S9N8A5_9GAMM|nr:ATP-binding protein [Zhongshania aliphaticivorans]CAA0082283.1 Swarming motility regulation sensor protein RssA [Zhongshania aliphaticivorans]CAA0084331.1 Swarming motility regulation sensor protein RssA [Zhongshania aliphaticivorans]